MDETVFEFEGKGIELKRIEFKFTTFKRCIIKFEIERSFLEFKIERLLVEFKIERSLVEFKTFERLLISVSRIQFTFLCTR